MLGGGSKTKERHVVRTTAGLLQTGQEVFNGLRLRNALTTVAKGRIQTGRASPRLRVVSLVEDDSKVLPLELVIENDLLHCEREGLNRYDDDSFAILQRLNKGGGFRSLLSRDRLNQPLNRIELAHSFG